MLLIRTTILIILWVGLMAGASSVILDGNSRVFFYLGLFLLGWLSLKFLGIGSRGRPQKPKAAYRYSKREIALMRREYDAKQRQLSIATDMGGDPAYFDSYGYKRDAFTGEYMYMNSSNTPNGDVFEDYPKQ